MTTEKVRQINFLTGHQDQMKPHQQVRFQRWLNHWHRTGEYLTANFHRLETTLKRLQAKSLEQLQLQAPKKAQPTIIYKKRRLIGGLKQDPSVEIVKDAK